MDTGGRPVFHKIPDSFDAARSDRERWRWLLVKAAELNPGLDSHVQFTFASFLHQQFGVQTLSAYSRYFAGDRAVSMEDSRLDDSSPYEVHTLTDNETLARLANGVKRFDLPTEFNYIRLFKEIARRLDQDYADDALRTLGGIYENRRLYDQALDYWNSYRNYNSTESRRHIGQIAKNWGVFEPVGTQPSGRKPTVEYRFRNGSEINFKAYRIKVERLLDDVKSYIRSNPWRLDWSKLRIDDIGWRLVHENQTKYIGREVAVWDLKLNPDIRHWDRRITVNLPKPLDQPGAYLLVGRIRDGKRLAFIGFSSVRYPNYYDREYNQAKTFIMTDRPVYRPKQKVRFKLWAAVSIRIL